MVNLIAGEQVVPELVQHDFTAENVVARVREILPQGPTRECMLHGLIRVKIKLNPPRNEAAGEVPQSPADRAAKIILDFLRDGSGEKAAAKS
jgi:lipid A disaccharide synthetase